MIPRYTVEIKDVRNLEKALESHKAACGFCQWDKLRPENGITLCEEGRNILLFGVRDLVRPLEGPKP